MDEVFYFKDIEIEGDVVVEGGDIVVEDAAVGAGAVDAVPPAPEVPDSYHYESGPGYSGAHVDIFAAA